TCAPSGTASGSRASPRNSVPRTRSPSVATRSSPARRTAASTIGASAPASKMAVMRVWLGVVCGVAACACAGGAGGARTAMPALLLPDLDQRAPQQVQVVWGGPPDHLRARLAFASNVEDIGWGPLVVVGRRPSLRVRTMR